MKNILALLIALTVSLSTSSMASRTMAISFEPVAAMHGAFKGLYQVKLADYMALTFPVSVGTNIAARSLTSHMSTITGDAYESALFFGGGGLGARFFLSNNGLGSSFFAESRITAAKSNYSMKKAKQIYIDSNRITTTFTEIIGLNLFFDSGLYIGTGIEGSVGYHVKNDITVDNQLKDRFAKNSSLKHKLWADESPWRFDYGYDLSLGFAW